MSETADRYAKALFEIAQEQNNLESVQSSLTEIRNLVLNKQDFRQFLSNPLITFEERSAILKALFEGKIPDNTLKFLIFITYKSRLNSLKNIIESFDTMYLGATHQMRAYVTTALPIEDEEKNFISEYLHKKFNQKIIIRWSLDPSLIGGFRIFSQGKIYDYSFKSQLNHFYQETTQLA